MAYIARLVDSSFLRACVHRLRRRPFVSRNAGIYSTCYNLDLYIYIWHILGAYYSILCSCEPVFTAFDEGLLFREKQVCILHAIPHIHRRFIYKEHKSTHAQGANPLVLFIPMSMAYIRRLLVDSTLVRACVDRLRRRPSLSRKAGIYCTCHTSYIYIYDYISISISMSIYIYAFGVY